ncbi:MAG TPA: 2-amino-4-hydroxy-6-hydroxymethyldihydropteridine diphosphokinase [Micavibrio sp.]|nr:2-amino-4-hydroxy-6-hydroxymethyldihydropteridine diphosphokinase [Micavibrio sp.]
MKIVALGANLPSRFGTPAQTLYAALKAMAEREIWPVQISRIWKTAPVPFVEGQPWYHNAVAAVETSKPANDLLKTLLSIEEEFGRVRTVRNAPRLLDLDLIAYDGQIIPEGPEIIVPHPRMDARAFVLLPMADILDEWAHPQTGATLNDLIAALPKDQMAEPVEGGWDE